MATWLRLVLEIPLVVVLSTGAVTTIGGIKIEKLKQSLKSEYDEKIEQFKISRAYKEKAVEKMTKIRYEQHEEATGFTFKFNEENYNNVNPAKRLKNASDRTFKILTNSFIQYQAIRHYLKTEHRYLVEPLYIYTRREFSEIHNKFFLCDKENVIALSEFTKNHLTRLDSKGFKRALSEVLIKRIQQLSDELIGKTN